VPSMVRPLSAPPPLAGRPTDGPHLVQWIESTCVYGQGAKHGDPVQLELFQKYLLHHLGELNVDGQYGAGRWRYRRALWEFPKGNGKTPLNAWVALYKLWHSRAPLIPVGATAREQADLLFSDMRACVDASDALQARLDAFEDRIVLKDGSGMAFKVAAKEGTNDGKRPSMYSADELHEMLTPQQVGAFERLVAGLKKRPDEALGLYTTTPGADLESLLGRLHAQGLKVNKHERGHDPRLLFVWYSADPALYVDLDDPAVLEAALRAANPAGDAFLDIAEHVAAYGDMPRFKYERLHLGRWTQVMSAWLPPGAWDGRLNQTAAAARTSERPGVPLGSQVVLGFDGSWSGDSTALVVCSLEDKVLGVVRVWEKPADARPDWVVPIAEVDAAIRKAFDDYDVRELVYDPHIWRQVYDGLHAEGFPVVVKPQGEDMVDAAQRTYEAVSQGLLSHDGDPVLARHFGNCVGRQTAMGVRVEKEDRSSTRWIDAAIAAVMAYDSAAALTEDAGVLVY
jgi:phage terminase large subunit-like protein